MEGDPTAPNTDESGHASKETSDFLDMVYIRGFPFPASARFIRENILSAMDYSPLDDDLIISSYPKTGTTWVEYIILQILHRGKTFPSMMELNHKLIPFMERVGASVAEKMDPPRRVKFHLPFHLIPYNKKAKYIYVVRNPKDVAVSYYHFRKSMGYDEVSTFDEFFDRFVSGQVPFGDYVEHIMSWLRYKNDTNLCIICYEKLCSEVKSEILRIARFLGDDHCDALTEDDELLNRILKTTSFDHMMQNLTVKIPAHDLNSASRENSGQRTVKFFRKGMPGDWKNHLSPAQSLLLDNKMEEMLGEESELLDLWKS